VQSLIHGIETFSAKHYNEYIMIAGDFNSLDCTALESECGLVQLVSDPTHCNNILDKVFTNRPDLYSAAVGKSLIKTKHHSVLVSATFSTQTPLPRRTRVKVYDLRAHNIDFLRWSVSQCDWNQLFASDDVQFIYDMFLFNVQMLIDQCIPAKLVTVGPRDPPYVTPSIKSLLRKHQRLRKRGHHNDANILAAKINDLISDFRAKQLSRLSDASTKELWAAVNGGKKTSNTSHATYASVESFNNYFASVCTHTTYGLDDVLYYYKHHLAPHNNDLTVSVYEVERMLSRMKPSSPGADAVPRWFYHYCSYELADIVAHIFNTSFHTGIVPQQWRIAIVTPVPKIPKPTSLGDYRPISVTPLLSRTAERLVVSNWLLPAIPIEDLQDQFGFRPTGSTTSALVSILHHVTEMLERTAFVRCLLVDFSKAFDVVDHTVLLAKLCQLSLPDRALNWIISFLTYRSQVVKCDNLISSSQPINASIVQGSGLGPFLYLVMAKDLKALSRINRLFKYADDTTVLVPSDSDVGLEDEFENVMQWAKDNKMILNINKTKEIVFRRPNPRLSLDPSPLPHIEQVKVAKLLGVVLSERLHFDDHVSTVLKVCSQRMYLLKLLRAQGLPLTQLNTIFQALILNKIRYAIPAWSGFLSVHLLSQINGLLKRCYKYGYCLKINTVEDIIESANYKLFKSLQSQQHCLHSLLPPIKPHNHDLRPKGHNYQIPNYSTELHKRSFIPHSLFQYYRY